MRIVGRGLLLLGFILLGGFSPVAAEYPERSVTLICPFPAGGAMDIVARNLVEAMKGEAKLLFSY